jgi:hypothetical protein
LLLLLFVLLLTLLLLDVGCWMLHVVFLNIPVKLLCHLFCVFFVAFTMVAVYCRLNLCIVDIEPLFARYFQPCLR